MKKETQDNREQQPTQQSQSSSCDISPWVEDVCVERDELADRLAKLRHFALTADFVKLSPEHRMLLCNQARVMQDYVDVLTDRLELAKHE